MFDNAKVRIIFELCNSLPQKKNIENFFTQMLAFLAKKFILLNNFCGYAAPSRVLCVRRTVQSCSNQGCPGVRLYNIKKFLNCAIP